MIFQINTDFLINQLAKYFCTRNITPLLYFEKEFALFIADVFRNIHFLPYFWVLFTVDEVCYISNQYQAPNNLAKHQYFYTRDYIPPLFRKKMAISTTKVFRNIYSLPLFHHFKNWARFVLFQVNTNFLINQLKNIFTQDTWHCSFMASKNLCSPLYCSPHLY